MNDDERSAAIGRAFERLIEFAWTDDDLRAGLRALASVVQALDERTAARTEAPVVAVQAVAVEGVEVAPSEPEVVAELPAISEQQVVETVASELVLEAATPEAPTPSRATRDSVPMARGELRALIEEAMHGMAATAKPAVEREATVGTPAPGPELLDETAARDEAVLQGLATRSRLRADVTQALAVRARNGTALAEESCTALGPKAVRSG